MSTPKYKVGNLVVYLDGVNSNAGSRSRGQIVDVVSKNGEVFYKIDSDNTGTIETISEYAIVGGPSKEPAPFVPPTPLNTSHLGPPPAWGSDPKPRTFYQTTTNTVGTLTNVATRKAGNLAAVATRKAGNLAAAARNKVSGFFGKFRKSRRKHNRKGRASRRSRA